MSENNPLGILDVDHLEFTCDSLSTKTRELFTHKVLPKLEFRSVEIKNFSHKDK